MALFAKIIPFKKLPRKMDFFDYQITEKFEKVIKVGSLVKIPFKKKNLLGIVFKIETTCDFPRVKPISDVLSTVPYLPQVSLKLVSWFAEHYFYSMASALNLMTPQPPAKNSKFKEKKILLGINLVDIPKKIADLSDTLLKTTKTTLLFPYDQSAKLALQLALIKNIIKKKKQALFLFPQINQVENFLENIPAEFQEKIAVLTNLSSKSKNQAFQLWKKIKLGEKNIIIGNRSAIFASFPELKMIFIDNADHDDFKNWDQNPRYSAIEVAKKIKEIQDCSLVLCSVCPRIEDYYEAREGSHQVIKLGKPREALKIIDLVEERRREFTYLSEPVIKYLDETLQAGKKSLLIVNKKGFASYLLCQDCHYIPKCPKCDFPLTYDKQHLKCFHCQTTTSTILSCPKCHGTNFKPLGIGLEQIKQLLKERYPDKLISDDLETTSDVYLSVAQIPESAIWKKISLLAIVYIDSLMYWPDFSTNYRIYQLLNQLRNQANLYAKLKTPIVLQTCFINNQAIRTINADYMEFYKKELAARKIFHYPPFKTLIKLFFQHHDKTLCLQEAKTIYNKLTKSFPNLDISPPYLYYRQQIRGRFRTQILLKIDKKDTGLLSELSTFLPDYWYLDRDPLSVL